MSFHLKFIRGTRNCNNEECFPLGYYAVLDLARTDVSEELSTSFIRVTRIGELGTTLAVIL
jgi:hypothetical protein